MKHRLPSGKHIGKLGRYVAFLARDGNKFPLTEPLWEKISDYAINSAVHDVKQIFDLPKELEDWVRDRLHERWKGYRGELKVKYFKPYGPQQAIHHKPPEIDETTWSILVNVWSTAKAKEIADRNSENRSKKKINHKGGSKPFRSYADELGEELNRSPTRMEIFAKTYLDPKNPNEGPAASLMKEMEEIQSKIASQEGSDDEGEDIVQLYGPNDVFCKVMGHDKGGIVRCYGNGAKRKRFWAGECSSKSSKKDSEVLVMTLTQRLEEAFERIAELEKQKQGANNTNTTSTGDNHEEAQ